MTGCSDPRARELDFWVGEWDCSWDGGTGVDRVSVIHEGCTVYQEFEDHSGDAAGLRGRSFSTYDPATGRWRQAWVDNDGSFMVFAGGRQGDEVVLVEDPLDRADQPIRRMRWYDISPDRMQWSWERSEDGGATWQVRWHIDYRRRAATGSA